MWNLGWAVAINPLMAITTIWQFDAITHAYIRIGYNSLHIYSLNTSFLKSSYTR